MFFFSSERFIGAFVFPAALVTSVAVSGCTRPPTPSGIALTDPQAAAIADSVRAFAASVARGVSDHGPTAWRDYFADTAAFFMASEGRLVFPTGDSAMRGIDGLGRVISHIELQWGDSLLVDPLAPGLAVLGATYHEVRVDQGRAPNRRERLLHWPRSASRSGLAVPGRSLVGPGAATEDPVTVDSREGSRCTRSR